MKDSTRSVPHAKRTGTQRGSCSPWCTAITFSSFNMAATRLVGHTAQHSCRGLCGTTCWQSETLRVNSGSLLERQIQWTEKGFTWRAHPQRARKISKQYFQDKEAPTREIGSKEQEHRPRCQDRGEFARRG